MAYLSHAKNMVELLCGTYGLAWANLDPARHSHMGRSVSSRTS
jgi:hypothetical protein